MGLSKKRSSSDNGEELVLPMTVMDERRALLLRQPEACRGRCMTRAARLSEPSATRVVRNRRPGGDAGPTTGAVGRDVR